MVLADHERDELLNDYIDGRLAESEREQVDILLSQDESLRAELERFQLISNALRSAPSESLGKSFAAEMMAHSALSKKAATEVENARFYRVAASVAAIAATLLLAWIIFQVNDTGSGPMNAPQIAGTADDSTNNDSGSAHNAGVSVADNNLTGQGEEPVEDGHQPDRIASNTDGNSTVEDINPRPNNGLNNPKPNSQDLVNMELLNKQRFLFVMEIGLSPSGSKNEVVKDVLMKHGIMFDKGVAVERPVEEELLESRFLQGIARKPSETDDALQRVELIYMVCSGLQVDESARDFHGRHDDVAAYRFNLALMKPEMQLFDHLHEAAGTQWVQQSEDEPENDEVARRREQLKQMKGKAGKVLLELVALAASDFGGTTALLSSGDDIPAPPPASAKRGNAKTNRKPGQMVLGGDLLCEVLVIVRHMSEDEIKQRAEKEE